ncbi:MAG: 1-acyl-sn-glycerol-3-phosphate acyltransferase [Thermoleophilia bacterium]|nr:1-acyl-sn-glycerol-3-phosphate acyltransferase [Thermoleophilia bacterium]
MSTDAAEDRARINPVTFGIAYVLCRPVFRLLFRLSRGGAQHVPRSGPVLFVSNHISGMDPPFLGAGALPRRLHFMAKKELFANPVGGWLIRSVGAFPVDRGGADRNAIRMAKDVLARGDALLMFPEGTRSEDGRLGPAWPGAGSLALDPGVTVVPMAIWGSQRRFGPVRIELGAPLDLGDLTEGSRAQRARQAAERMMEAIGELLVTAGGPGRA